MSRKDKVLFETEAEAKAFLAGVRYLNVRGLTAQQDEATATTVVVTLLEDDELEPPQMVYQDLAAYVSAFAAAGFELKELEIGDNVWVRWEQLLADGRLLVVSMVDGIRIPGYDDETEVRIYRNAELPVDGLELRKYDNPKEALLTLCQEFRFPAPKPEDLDAEYEKPF